MPQLLAFFLLITLSVAPAHAVSRFTQDEAKLLQEGLVLTADDFILPGYKALADDLSEMNAASRAYCTEEGEIEKVQNAFGRAFLAWQRISIIQIGPIMEKEGPMRFQLWPDPKGFSRRAIRAAVKAEDPALLAKGGLADRSIALVNMSALEHLLYGELKPKSYGCDLAVAIGQYQTTLAGQLVADWSKGSAFRTEFDAAARGNERYLTVDDAVRELLAGMVVYADRLHKFKILRGFGTEPGATRPERTEAAKSGLGLQSIITSFRALSDLYNVPYGLFDITPDLGATMEYYLLGETVGNIADALVLEKRSLVDIAMEDGEMADKLRSYGELTLLHESYLKVNLPQSIGLTTGFTSADGD